jgi:hypothetical protein
MGGRSSRVSSRNSRRYRIASTIKPAAERSISYHVPAVNLSSLPPAIPDLACGDVDSPREDRNCAILRPELTTCRVVIPLKATIPDATSSTFGIAALPHRARSCYRWQWYGPRTVANGMRRASAALACAGKRAGRGKAPAGALSDSEQAVPRALGQSPSRAPGVKRTPTVRRLTTILASSSERVNRERPVTATEQRRVSSYAKGLPFDPAQGGLRWGLATTSC